MKFKVGDKLILKTEKELLIDGFIKEDGGFRCGNIFLNNEMIRDYKNKEIIIKSIEEYDYYGYDIEINSYSTRSWSWSTKFFNLKRPKQLELFNEV